MTFKEKELIKWLLTRNEPDLHEFEQHLHASRDEVTAMIHALNGRLASGSVGISGQTVTVPVQCADELNELLLGTYYSPLDDMMNLRKSLIELELLTRKKSHSLQTLSERFYVSRNTVYTDIKQIKKELAGQQLTLSYSRKTGYRISGPEYLLRNHLVQVTRHLLKSFYGKAQLTDFHYIIESDYKKLKSCLLRIEEKA